ncbi:MULTISPECIES: hypothetical protein [unclassified Ensifer]|uniref:hypothetical protein n=1 Tax=unclassified Ensifer TaxID=2633371 RepID=UPI00081365BE|nr:MULTISPECIES: hypothetical protein [unclassified Ensifer]OCP23160.1 hypothetical protein BC361_23365 [Ensifer sp. LC54]OCP24988.1 hypothetical protein BC363_21545 [Ensifer sp. LC384]
MAQNDKTLNWVGLPARIQSVREAINYFDESPALSNKRIAQVEAPHSAEARFRYPPVSELLSDDFGVGAMPSHGAPGIGSFSTRHPLLPTESFRQLVATDRAADNIASKARGRDRVAEGGRMNAAMKSTRDGSNDIGWSDFGSVLGSAIGGLLGSGAASVAGAVGGHYLGGYGPGPLKETGRAVGRGGFNGDLSGLR